MLMIPSSYGPPQGRDTVVTFFEHLNGIQNTPGIKFTMKPEEGKTLSFLKGNQMPSWDRYIEIEFTIYTLKFFF